MILNHIILIMPKNHDIGTIMLNKIKTEFDIKKKTYIKQIRIILLITTFQSSYAIGATLEMEVLGIRKLAGCEIFSPH